ncbi:hypothetical protein ACIXHV_20990 [Bacteroides fragilis]
MEVPYNCPNLTYILMLNLGRNPEMTGLLTNNDIVWGTGGETNRQSLVDSLLTYSFNRAQAGYPPFRIPLPPRVRSLLTEEEKAAITEKGFTLA